VFYKICLQNQKLKISLEGLSIFYKKGFLLSPPAIDIIFSFSLLSLSPHIVYQRVKPPAATCSTSTTYLFPPAPPTPSFVGALSLFYHLRPLPTTAERKTISAFASTTLPTGFGA